jgi:regulator of cell morphogenesis and NO signaling
MTHRALRGIDVMSRIDPERSLAELVEDNPWRARVFTQAGLDFVDLGDRPLDEACEARDIDLQDVQLELAAIERRDDANEPVQFSNLTELADYIEQHHHAFLRDELEPLSELAADLRDALGQDHQPLKYVAEQLSYMARDLPAHLDREETILFPAVRALEGNASDDVDPDADAALDLIVGLEEDHDNYEKSLWQIRDVTDNYQMPDHLDADQQTRYVNLLARLEGLERDMQMHIHRENNVLFRDFRRRSRD